LFPIAEYFADQAAFLEYSKGRGTDNLTHPLVHLKQGIENTLVSRLDIRAAVWNIPLSNIQAKGISLTGR
jgi:hypothetical protein